MDEGLPVLFPAARSHLPRPGRTRLLSLPGHYKSMSNQNRHPEGTSVGGQWAPGASGEVEMSLDDAFDTAPEQRDAYLDTLLSEVGTSTDACPGLNEAWTKRYGEARMSRQRDEHLRMVEEGVEGPWSVMADRHALVAARTSARASQTSISLAGISDENISVSDARSARACLDALDGNPASMGAKRMYPKVRGEALASGGQRADSSLRMSHDFTLQEAEDIGRQAQDGGPQSDAAVLAGVYRASLRGVVSSAEERNEKIRAATDRHNAAADQRWALGWTGDPERLPPRPNRSEASTHEI